MSEFNEKEKQLIDDRAACDMDREQLNANISRYDSGYSDLAEQMQSLVDRLKIVTKRELELETRETAAKQRDSELKTEYTSVLREQKRLKKIKKESQDEQSKMKAEQERVQRLQRRLNNEQSRLKSDQRDFNKVKKRHQDNLKKEHIAVKKKQEQLKQKERELADEQRQLLQDNIGDDTYAQLVELRKTFQKLNFDPEYKKLLAIRNLQQEEKEIIEQMRTKHEAEIKAFE